MTYAYDDYVQMPTKDLYDTAVMKMAIEAAKDMYDKGLALMENFYKTYGDFMSPFAADMQKYGAAMDHVRQTVNDAYARGIDLFKSPEGRAIVALLSHSIDPGWYNRARLNAKVGYAYLESMRDAMKNGTYDRDFLNFLLSKENGGPGAFEDFSSDNGMWNVSGVSKFQDLNQWTHHLFDNMQLTYDPELSKSTPGFLAYSKNKDVMNQIAANNMATLANTDMGKYMIDRYAQQFKARGYSDDKALEAAFDMLQRNIVNANYEQSQVKLEQDPYAYLQQSKAADLENFRQKELIKQQIAMDLEERELYYGALKKQLSGQSDENIPPAGVTDELINLQILDERDRRQLYDKGRTKEIEDATKTQKDNLKKLTGPQRVVAKLMMAYDKLSSNDLAAKDARTRAQELAAKDPKFKKWFDSYNEQRTKSGLKWGDEYTTSGKVGYRQPDLDENPSTENELYKNSEDIYKKNNVVSDLSKDQEVDLNRMLKYKTNDAAKDGEDDLYAYADNTVEFRPIVTASMTGSRVYTHDSIVNKVSRIIKGKKYTINSNDIRREYAAGTSTTYHKTGVKDTLQVYNIGETVRFSDPETVEALSKLGDENLAKFGITKEEDGDKVSYLVPIIHKYKHSVGSSSVNTESDKRVRGSSEAAKLQPHRLAKEYQQLIK